MANPSKNKYGVYMYVARVPADLVHVVGKKVYSVSLGTKDPKEARRLFNEMVAKKDREHAALRSAPGAVPHRTLLALAGEFYREVIEGAHESAVTSYLEMMEAGLGARRDDFRWLTKEADALLQRNGIAADEDSRTELVAQLNRVLDLAYTETVKVLTGDASPDENLKRFPQVSRKAEPKPAVGRVSITDLYDLWKREHLADGRAQKTAEDYKSKINYFVKWLQCDDALSVTKKDIAAFVDHLRHEKELSLKTVHGKYLVCIKAVFRVGFDKDLLPINVAASVRGKKDGRAKSTRGKGFTDAEAKAILAVANRSLLPTADGSRERRSIHNRRAGRWVPWLQCYTGARVAEITQLRKEDILLEHGIHCLRITPDAGSVKTGRYRLVPIHPHLIEMGFVDFVRSSNDGPLFYDPKERREGSNTPAQWAGNALARWIKGELGDAWPGIQPNHAWRHRFKTISTDVDIHPDYQKVLQGWATTAAADGYGETTIRALYREIQKIPKILAE